MDFADQLITIETRSRPVRVRVTADALHAWWGEGVGPQTAEGVIAASMGIIETIVADKLERGDIGEDGVVVVSAMDYEDEGGI